MRSLICAFALSVALFTSPAGARPVERPAGGEERLCTLFIHSGAVCLDEKIRRELDRVVPKLVSLGPGYIVKIEGYSSRGEDEEERVRNSIYLAWQAQKYLSGKHRLKLDLYVAAAPKGETAKGDFVRVVALSDAFVAIQALQVGTAP